MKRKELIESLKELLSDEWDATEWHNATKDEILLGIIDAAFYYKNLVNGDVIINTELREKIKVAFFRFCFNITMNVPENHEEIVDFIYKDIFESADVDNWIDSNDVIIGFRRWIESKNNNSQL